MSSEIEDKASYDVVNQDDIVIDTSFVVDTLGKGEDRHFFGSDDVKACTYFSSLVYDKHFIRGAYDRIDYHGLNQPSFIQAAALKAIFGVDKSNPIDRKAIYPSYMHEWLDENPPRWIQPYQLSWVFSSYNDSHVCVFLNKDTATIIVAFRGSSTASNFLTDLQAFQKKVTINIGNNHAIFGKVDVKTEFLMHTGFYNSYKYLDKHLKMKLEKLIKKHFNHSKVRVIFTGHSLGGAMASISALAVSRNLAVDKVQLKFGCIPIASPCIGDESFAKFYRDQIPESQTLRLVNLGDGIVTLWYFGTCCFNIGLCNSIPICVNYQYSHITQNYIRLNPGFGEDCGHFCSCLPILIGWIVTTGLYHSTEAYAINTERLMRVQPKYNYSCCFSVAGQWVIPIEYGHVENNEFSGHNTIYCCYEEIVRNDKQFLMDCCLSMGVCCCCYTEVFHQWTRGIFYTLCDK